MTLSENKIRLDKEGKMPACNEAAAWGSGGFHHCSCGLLDRKVKQNFERDKAAIAPNCLLAARRMGQQKNILKI